VDRAEYGTTDAKGKGNGSSSCPRHEGIKREERYSCTLSETINTTTNSNSEMVVAINILHWRFDLGSRTWASKFFNVHHRFSVFKCAD
jgi:hypothetical protein